MLNPFIKLFYVFNSEYCAAWAAYWAGIGWDPWRNNIKPGDVVRPLENQLDGTWKHWWGVG